jgi:hypothetical protein
MLEILILFFINVLDYYQTRLKFIIKRFFYNFRKEIFNQTYYPTKQYYTIALNPPILRNIFLEHSFPNHSLFELAFLDTYKLSTISNTEIPVEKYTLNSFLSDLRDNSKYHLLNFIKFSNVGGVFFIKEDERGEVDYEDLCELFNTVNIKDLNNYEIVVDTVKIKKEVIEMIPMYKTELKSVVKTREEHYKESVEYMLPEYKNKQCKYRFHMKKNI